MRWLVLLLFLLAVAAGVLVYTSKGYEQVMALPVGEGRGMVAAGLGDLEQAAVCPLGVDAADGEELVLFDLSNSKVLALDPVRNRFRENALDIDPSIIVEGALFDQGTIFVWGQDASGAQASIDALALNEDGIYWRRLSRQYAFHIGGRATPDGGARLPS